MKKFFTLFFTLICLVSFNLFLNCSKSVAKPAKVGIVLYEPSSQAYQDSVKGIKTRLLELGYSTQDIEVFPVEGADKVARIENAKILFQKLDAGNYDVLLTSGTDATLIAKDIVKTKPVVFFTVADPISAGIVKSLVEPEGNITGVSSKIPAVKPMGIFLQASPNLKKIGILNQAGSKAGLADINDILAAKDKLKIEVVVFDIKDEIELKEKADSIAKSADAFFMPAQSLFSSHGNIFIEAANNNNKPTLVLKDYMVTKWNATMGVVINFEDIGKKTADVVNKISNGQKTSLIPIEMPEHFPLIINYRSAKSINLDISPEILSIADQIIDE